jgi:hypothetical protein
MSFMQPQLMQTGYWRIETEAGLQCIPTDVADYPADPWNDDREEYRADFTAAFQDYLEGTNIQDAQSVTLGFLWRLSAAGYTDCTEWAPADSIPEAVRDMLGMYGDSFDLEDWRTVGAWLEGFDEFWEGYLLGLAFTGHQEGAPDAPYEGPIFSNPGGDISGVVDTGELEGNIPNDTLADLYGDCVSFYLDALPLIGTEYERAGSDFHLTRNGHGAGFWGGDWPENGDKLTELSKPYGTAELVLADGEYYVHN